MKIVWVVTEYGLYGVWVRTESTVHRATRPASPFPTGGTAQQRMASRMGGTARTGAEGTDGWDGASGCRGRERVDGASGRGGRGGVRWARVIRCGREQGVTGEETNVNANKDEHERKPFVFAFVRVHDWEAAGGWTRARAWTRVRVRDGEASVNE